VAAEDASDRRKPRASASPAAAVEPDAAAVDALYGLEPVFEPGAESAAGLAAFVRVDCPFCGETFETAVDCSAGAFRYIEDCQVCCQPIELAGDVDDDGAPRGVTAIRS
jgi:hypothetical protein